jgi:hypothetical protein
LDTRRTLSLPGSLDTTDAQMSDTRHGPA